MTRPLAARSFRSIFAASATSTQSESGRIEPFGADPAERLFERFGRPESRQETEAALKALPGVESHRMSDDGRLIVTVEDAHGAAMSDTLIAIHRVPQVLAATLAYEYTDNTLAIPTNSPCQEVHP